MEINYTELGLIIGVIYAILELIKYVLNLVYKIFIKQTDKGGIDNKQEIDIAILKEKIINFETNCFPTINRKLDKLEEKIDSINKLLLK